MYVHILFIFKVFEITLVLNSIMSLNAFSVCDREQNNDWKRFHLNQIFDIIWSSFPDKIGILKTNYFVRSFFQLNIL